MSIKSVGGVPVLPKHRLTCHCGAVVIELELPDGIVDPRRCDCSICRRKGAVVASVPLSGIYTHHQRRSFPNQYGYNVGCLEGINPFLLGEVPVNDGLNHPAERTAPGTA